MPTAVVLGNVVSSTITLSLRRIVRLEKSGLDEFAPNGNKKVESE